MNNGPESAPRHLWSVYRRPILLAGLVIGLIMLLIWLPGLARAKLLAAFFAQRTLVGMLFLFALVALSLVWSAGQRLDTWVFLLLNLRGYHQKWLDRVMWLVTQLGNMMTAFIAAFVFFVADFRRLAVEIVLGTLTLWLLVEIIKTLTDRARPYHVLGETRVIGWGEAGRSFPSGHTAQTFFLMMLFSHQFQFGLTAAAALYAVAVLVGFTRIYVGAHYPRDVIGGVLLGCIWGILAALVDTYWLGLRF